MSHQRKLYKVFFRVNTDNKYPDCAFEFRHTKEILASKFTVNIVFFTFLQFLRLALATQLLLTCEDDAHFPSTGVNNITDDNDAQLVQMLTGSLKH